MSNNEDYLDGLLNSITKARTDSQAADQRAKAERQAKQNTRDRIPSSQDFLDAKGLGSYESKPMQHSNLRRALTEADFLRDFEAELTEGDADAFLRDFDEQIGRESSDAFVASDSVEEEEMIPVESIPEEAEEIPAEEEEISIELPTSNEEETSAQADTLQQTEVDSSVEEPREAPEDSSKESMSIESLLAEARNKMEGSEEENDSDSPEIPVIPEMPVGKDGEEVDLSQGLDDEEKSDDDTDDLMSLLAKGEPGEFGDLSDLLGADESGEELEESRATFEQAVSTNDFVDEGPDEDSEEEGSSKKGFLQKILGIFKKEKKTEETVEEPDSLQDNEAILEARALDAENQQILAEMGDAPSEPELDPNDDGTGLILNFFKKRKAKKAEAKAEKEAQPKPEKPKKEKKEKPKKEKKPKPKKEKKVDTSPVIPLKNIILHLLLAISIVALVLIGTKLIGNQLNMSRARQNFDNGNYVEAYEMLVGGSYGEEGDALLIQARLLTDLQSRIIAADNLYEIGEYEYSLNQLLVGYSHYQSNLTEAEEYGVADQYTALFDQIVENLMSKFNVTQDRAQSILRNSSRTQYTRALRDVLRELDILED